MTTPALPTTELQAPAEMIGRYGVVGLVGKGGMATTLLCTLSGDGGFRKWVIVKRMLKEHRDDPAFVDMFHDEARLGARLEHPNIPRVFEVGEHRGVPYFVMDYVRGPTLHDLVRRSLKGADPSIPRVCWILAQIARAVDHAWYGTDSAGEPLQVLHRDISLSNILVTHSGTPKLIDFGIARFDGRLTKTDSGVLKGKVQYMAPEQIFAKPLDHRVDVFQLGVALFFATTGRRPFSAKSAPELWKQRLSGKIPAPADVFPDFPEPLDAIIRRAMAYSAEDRYPRARDLAVALEDYLAGLPREPVSEEEIGRWIETLYPPQDRPWQPDVLPETDPSLWRPTKVETYEQPSGMTRTHWMAIALALLLTGLVAVPGMLVAAGSSLVAPNLAGPQAGVASAPPPERVEDPVAVVVDDVPPPVVVPRPTSSPVAPKVDAAARVVERGGTRMTIGQDGQMVAMQQVFQPQARGSLLPWVLVGLAMAATLALLVAAVWWLWVGPRPEPGHRAPR